MDAIAAFAEHVVGTGYDDLPAPAIAAAKTFILDSFGVGVAGSAAPWAKELVDTATRWGSGEDARVWVHGAALPAPAAAMCNGWQIHNSEYDCVHEAAVVHPMAVLLSATVAHAERAGGVSGPDLLCAIALGVDVGAGLGVASKAPLRFFRPATARAFAATAAIGRLMGFRYRHPDSCIQHRLRPAVRHHAGPYRRLAAAGHADRLQCAKCRRGQ
jgi:aconitate decarboxylase